MKPPGVLEAALRQALARPELRILSADGLSGGCIHQAARLRTTSGDYFAKWNPACDPGLFPGEAAGLQALRAAGSGLVVPAVVAASGPVDGAPGFLVLEFLPPAGRGAPSAEEALGRGLAALHRRTAARFGFAATTFCGSTAQDNRAAAAWPEFYAERRLRPLLDALSGRAERAPFERVIERLPEWLAGGTEPSLIHGDLWSGNVLATVRGPALVDPAAAFCDREMEFGISTLFGGLSPRAMAAYEEAWPLPAGWRDRNGLYQLYHLLNHALLFGGHYFEEARRVARRYGG